MRYRLSSKMLAEKGDIAEEMMYNTFNMGLGMIVAVDPADVEKPWKLLRLPAMCRM